MRYRFEIRCIETVTYHIASQQHLMFFAAGWLSSCTWKAKRELRGCDYIPLRTSMPSAGKWIFSDNPCGDGFILHSDRSVQNYLNFNKIHIIDLVHSVCEITFHIAALMFIGKIQGQFGTPTQLSFLRSQMRHQSHPKNIKCCCTTDCAKATRPWTNILHMYLQKKASNLRSCSSVFLIEWTDSCKTQ